MTPRVYLVRHGETAWSQTGQHTSTTDLPLTENGRARARRMAPALARITFARVLTSPLGRARETCELVGLGGQAEIDPELTEWHYGDYEGLTSKQIHEKVPGWLLFTDGCPNGESPAQVGARIDRVIDRIRAADGNVAVFAHGHFFRVLASRWIGLPPSAGARLLLETATISVLSSYQGIPAIEKWNTSLED